MTTKVILYRNKVGGLGLRIAAGDIDNDTHLDVIVSGETIQIFQSDGVVSEIPTTGNVQIVDADLDGDLDVVVNGTEFSVWEQDGTPSRKRISESHS